GTIPPRRALPGGLSAPPYPSDKSSGQHRAQRRRCHQVRIDRVGTGCRAREYVAQLRVVVENVEQSCEAHDVLVIAVSPSCWLPLAPDLTRCGQHEPAGPRQNRLSAEPFKFTRFAAAARVRNSSPPPPRRVRTGLLFTTPGTPGSCRCGARSLRVRS